MNTRQPVKTLVFLYARISNDPRDQRRGVDRQVDDLKSWSTDEDWEIAGIWVENDVSAFSGAPRPEYEACIAAALAEARRRRPGVRVMVGAWHSSRLWRDSVERPAAIKELGAAGVWVGFEQDTLYDLSKASQRAALRRTGEGDTSESELKSERVKRAAVQRAREGKAAGVVSYGWRRVREFDDRGNVVDWRDEEHPEQAEIVREVVQRVLAGGSLRGITDDLNARQVPPPGAHLRLKRRASGNQDGSRWGPNSVKKLATRPANAGIRSARRPDGAVEEFEAQWPALVSREDHQQVVALLASRTTAAGRPAVLPGQRVHLLSGEPVGTCGPCGAPLRVAWRGNAKYGKKYELYCCDSSKGCTGRNKARLDEHVEGVVIEILKSPEAVEALRPAGPDLTGLRDRVDALNAEIEMIRGREQSGALSLVSALDMIGPREAERDRLQAELDAAAAGFAPDQHPGLVGPGAAEVWGRLTLPQRRAVIEGIGLRVVLWPGRKGPGFDRESVEILPGVQGGAQAGACGALGPGPG